MYRNPSIYPFDHQSIKYQEIEYDEEGQPWINFTLFEGLVNFGVVLIWSAKQYLRSSNECLLYTPKHIREFIENYKR